MTPALQAIVAPLFVHLGYAQAKMSEPNTAVSVVVQATEQQPTATFEVTESVESSHRDALNWLALSQVVLPNAQPLTPEERSSINEFFWSHFE